MMSKLLQECSYEYCNENSIDSNLICSICLNPFRQPVVTACRHTFCWECLRSWSDEEPSCPICRRDVLPGRYDWVTKACFLQQLGRLRVQCSFCSQTGIRRSHFNNHLNYRCKKPVTKRLVQHVKLLLPEGFQQTLLEYRDLLQDGKCF